MKQPGLVGVGRVDCADCPRPATRGPPVVVAAAGEHPLVDQARAQLHPPTTLVGFETLAWHSDGFAGPGGAVKQISSSRDRLLRAAAGVPVERPGVANHAYVTGRRAV
jgi:hypothetical protein